MLNFRENRDQLIQKAIEEARVVEFEYKPSEIIKSLFEDNKFDTFRDRKIKSLQENTFFSNSSTYLKKIEGSQNGQNDK